MSALPDAEFLQLLKKDVDYFRHALERFENLLPEVCSQVQDQWRLQAQARRNFTLELEVLLQKAERCAQLAMTGANHHGGHETAPW
ncbi:MAG: hypothetical protein WCC95_06215 [Candidatus Sulfotelmatobacter sp.]|jgi:hypothetical protein